MSFTADWLALREPADVAARSSEVAAAVSTACDATRELAIVDLASGTGANVRYLVPRLPPRQRWLAVDADAPLLAGMPSAIATWAPIHGYQFDSQAGTLRSQDRAAHVAMSVTDLASLPAASHVFDGRQIVTASALLDLVSEAWIGDLVDQCARRDALMLFALNYDGRIRWTPAEPEDEAVRMLVNRHQRTDKGFGPAAGPDAAATLQERLLASGYNVRREPSDWILSPDHAALQRQLIDGWAAAAVEVSPDRRDALELWRRHRQAHVDGARSHILVGHVDVGAWRG